MVEKITIVIFSINITIPIYFKFLFLVAQWSRRLATNQEIPGSSPGGEEFLPRNTI